MIGMNISLDGEGCWPDLTGILKDPSKVIDLTDTGASMKVAVMPQGTMEGLPSVIFRLDLPDGRTVLAQTTARLVCSLARMIEGRYPEVKSS